MNAEKNTATESLIVALTDAVSTGVYARLYKPLVARICAEEAPKYKNDRERIKAVKTRLHRLYGAYADQTAAKKRAVLLDTDRESLLRLHASTRERMPYIAAFYGFIQTAVVTSSQTAAVAPAQPTAIAPAQPTAIAPSQSSAVAPAQPTAIAPAQPTAVAPAQPTAAISTVLDLGCGYNPFAIPWMPWRDHLTAYYAYDIDTETTRLINRYLTALGLPAAANEADLAVETPKEYADVALLCKLLPVLDAQKKGRGFDLLESLNTRFTVVTFPLKSLGGREKGMRSHYKGLFETYLKQPGCSYLMIDQSEIGGELVYVLARRQRIS